MKRLMRAAVPVLVLAGSALFLYGVAKDAGIDSIRAQIASADRGLLLVAALANLSTYFLWSARWTMLLRPVSHAPWLSTLKALFASVFVNTVVPFARSFGGLVRAGYLSSATGLPMGPVYGATLIDQIGYATMSVILGALTVPFLAVSRESTGGRTSSYAAMAAAGGTIALAAALYFSSRQRREAFGAKVRGWTLRSPALARAAQGIAGASDGARATLARPSSYAVVAFGSLAVWSANVLTIWVAGHALGATFGLSAAAAAWSLGSMAGIASGTPGGAGTTEALAVVPLVALGVPKEIALASILVARSFQYASALLIGGSCLVLSHRGGKTERPRLASAGADHESGAGRY